MNEFDCFAATEKDCKALKVTMKDCLGERCAFYKSNEKHKKEQKAVDKRLSKLGADKLQKIDDTYRK